MFYTILRAGGENFKVIVGVVASTGPHGGLLHKKGRHDSMADKRAAQQAEMDAAQKEAQVRAGELASSEETSERASRPGCAGWTGVAGARAAIFAR